MFLSHTPPAIFTLFTFTLSFLFSVSFGPSAFAQKYTPVVFDGYCDTFVEGQGLYFVGSTRDDTTSSRLFMLDLSVSWNTSDPVYKRLKSLDNVLISQCAMASDGEHLFVLENDVGFVYNMRSDTWTEFNENGMKYEIYATADPETGFIYLPASGENSKGQELMLTLDLRTRSVNKTVIPPDVSYGFDVFWSAYLKSMVMIHGSSAMELFTPSKVSKSSTGWSKLKIPMMPSGNVFGLGLDCVVPVDGGRKLVSSVASETEVAVYIFDFVTQIWKVGPLAPSIFFPSCAVSGDQFILWGGEFGTEKDSAIPFVYNMKTEKWTTQYTAPSSRSTTATPTPHTPYTTPDHSNASSSDMKLITIVVVVIGSLLVIILTAVNIYLGISKRSKVQQHDPNLQSTRVLPDNNKHTKTQ